MESTRIINVGLLEGKSNWSTWKYKMHICLRGIPGALDVIEGRLVLPHALSENASAEEKSSYKTEVDTFNKADSNALLVLTTNMTEETLMKIMRLKTSREVWLELHKLFDGVSEDKVYNLCLQFFSYDQSTEHDIATHISKLKNMWSELKQEMAREKENNTDLPDVFLICKILGTLPNDYFSFKSSWMLLSKSDRTVDNLTNQLCAYERALKTNQNGCEKEALVSVTSNYTGSGQSKQLPNAAQQVNSTNQKRKKLICVYCKKPGHTIKVCRKWIGDGRPPKPNKIEKPEQETNMILVAVTSTVMNVECSYDGWYVDNGATSHISNDRDCFRTFQPFSTQHSITTANGDKIKAIGKGEIDIEAAVNGKWQRLTLTDVWYAPEIKKNIFSVLAAQDKQKKSQFVSTAKMCNFKVNNEVKLVGTRQRHGGLFKLNVKSVKIKLNEVNAATKEDTLQLYHKRFGHQNKRHIKSLLSREFNIEVRLDNELCEGCIYGKAHRLPFGTRSRTTEPGERIHTDVCGPFQESFSGYRYFVLFKDDYTKFRSIYFMKQKSEVAEKLNQFLAEARTTGHTVKELLSDNGKEFNNENVKRILRKDGIVQRFTMPYTPEQNGSSERENRTVVETARAMMHAHGNISQSLWAEMIRTAAYILNRTGPTHVPGTSPFELWYGRKPGLKHLRVIGSTCYVHVPKQQRTKMDRKAKKGILIGYDHDDGYRIYSEEDCKLIRSRDVIFEEKLLDKGDIFLPENNEAPNQRQESVSFDRDLNDSAENRTFTETPEAIEEEAEGTLRRLRNRNTLKAPQKFQDYVMHVSTAYNEPETYSDAMKSDQKDNWKEAMDREMKALRVNRTWELVNQP